MIKILRPLFVWRKYLLAEKLLDEASKLKAIGFINDDNGKEYSRQYAFVGSIVSDIHRVNKNIPIERIIEAIEILAKNKHVNLTGNQDIYRMMYVCTKEGEIAVRDGYYMKIVYKKLAIIIGSPIVLFLITQIPKMIKSLNA